MLTSAYFYRIQVDRHIKPGITMEIFLLLLLIIQAVLIGLLCSYVAGQKNRSRGNWFILGFFFSLLALIALAAIPSISIRTESEKWNLSTNKPDTVLPREAPKSIQAFTGVTDLNNDEYKIWLVDQCKITKNETLSGFICDKKIFPTIEAALLHAHNLYSSEPAAIELKPAEFSMTAAEAALVKQLGIHSEGERYIWNGNHFKALSAAIAFAQSHASAASASSAALDVEEFQIATLPKADLAALLRAHNIRFEEDRYIWQGNHFKRPADAIAYAERHKSSAGTPP